MLMASLNHESRIERYLCGRETDVGRRPVSQRQLLTKEIVTSPHIRSMVILDEL